MALGRQEDRQGDLLVTWREMSRLPGHVFYDRLQAAETNLASVDREPSTIETAERVANCPKGALSAKGYHSRGVLKDLAGGAWKTRIAEPQRKTFSCWHGDEAARRALYASRNRLRPELGKQSAESAERAFAHNLERGGMRRTWLRGRKNVHKRYLIYLTGPNLGILMRHLIGAGGTVKLAGERVG